LGSTSHSLRDKLSLLSWHSFLSWDSTVDGVDDFLTASFASFIVGVTESVEKFLDSVLVLLSSAHDSTNSITDTELGQIEKGLLLEAVLTVPLTFDLVPDRAAVVSATIVADFLPACLILLVRLVALKIFADLLANLFHADNTVGAVLRFPIVPVESNVLGAAGLTSAWVCAVSEHTQLTVLAVLDFALWSAWVVHKVAEPVTF
jgi:hypothetical protein